QVISFIFYKFFYRIYFNWFFFSSRRRHTRSKRDWSSDVCSSDLGDGPLPLLHPPGAHLDHLGLDDRGLPQRQLSEPSALPGHEVAAGEEPEQVGHRVHSALGQGVAVLLAEIVFEPGRHSTPMMTSTPGSLESKSWKWTLSWDFAIHSCSRSRTS